MNKALRGNYAIIKNEEIAQGVFELCVEAPEIARAASAGQFVNVYLPGGAMLLPRPIGIADADGGSLTLVYGVVGAGTEALSHFNTGGHIEIMGPLGTGFLGYAPAARRREIALIGGGTGIPPLLFAAREIRANEGGDVKLTAWLGFREKPWYIEKLARFCDEVRIASETEGAAGFFGNVTDLLAAEQGNGFGEAFQPDLALACGPRSMLAAIAGWCGARDIPLRVSLEERMGCGYGACAGCTIATRPLNDAAKPQNGPNIPDANGIIQKKVCAHGPVFWADEVVW